jgi:hypothetical protein
MSPEINTTDILQKLEDVINTDFKKYVQASYLSLLDIAYDIRAGNIPELNPIQSANFSNRLKAKNFRAILKEFEMGKLLDYCERYFGASKLDILLLILEIKSSDINLLFADKMRIARIVGITHKVIEEGKEIRKPLYSKAQLEKIFDKLFTKDEQASISSKKDKSLVENEMSDLEEAEGIQRILNNQLTLREEIMQVKLAMGLLNSNEA